MTQNRKKDSKRKRNERLFQEKRKQNLIVRKNESKEGRKNSIK